MTFEVGKTYELVFEDTQDSPFLGEANQFTAVCIQRSSRLIKGVGHEPFIAEDVEFETNCGKYLELWSFFLEEHTGDWWNDDHTFKIVSATELPCS